MTTRQQPPAHARTRAAAARPAALAAPPGLADSDAATRVLRQFRLVFNAVKTHFQQVQKQAGIGGAQLWALAVLQGAPGIGVTELARRLDIRQSTASNLVRALAQAGLVRVERGRADRRSVQLHLQPAGRRVLRQAPGPFAGVLPQALQRLQPRTLARLEADLAALLQVLQADDRGAQLPLAMISQSLPMNENDSH